MSLLSPTLSAVCNTEVGPPAPPLQRPIYARNTEVGPPAPPLQRCVGPHVAGCMFMIHAVATVQAAEALGKLAYSFDARQELQAIPPTSAAEHPRVLSSTCLVLGGSTHQRSCHSHACAARSEHPEGG